MSTYSDWTKEAKISNQIVVGRKEVLICSSLTKSTPQMNERPISFVLVLFAINPSAPLCSNSSCKIADDYHEVIYTHTEISGT